MAVDRWPTFATLAKSYFACTLHEATSERTFSYAVIVVRWRGHVEGWRVLCSVVNSGRVQQLSRRTNYRISAGNHM